MTSIGLMMAFIGYAILYWAINAIQDKSQDSFITYIFPFGGSHG